MKRYSASIVFATIILIGLISFYAIFSVRAETFNENIIKTVQGDPKEIKDVTLYGSGFINNYSSLITAKKDSLSIKPITLTNTMDRYQEQSNEQYRRLQLIEQYKSFMRGKDYLPFYEDKTIIIVAPTITTSPAFHAEKGEIELEYFDKVEETSHSFTVEIPKEYINNEYLNVEDIQVDGQKANIILRGMEGQSTDIFALTVHMQQQKVIAHHHMFSSKMLEEKGMKEGNYSVEFYGEKSTATAFMPLTIHDNRMTSPNIMLYSMDLEKGLTTEISLPEKIMNEAAIYTVDNKFYYVSESSGTLFEVDLKSQKVVPIIKNDVLKDNNIKDIVVHDQQVYVLVDIFGKSISKTSLLKVDLKSKQILYRGDLNNTKFLDRHSKVFNGSFVNKIMLDDIY